MEQPFIFKYKPNNLDEYKYNKNICNFLKNLININELNILIIGNTGSGKTTLINCLLNDYYDGNYNEQNVLTINQLKDQGITYYRNDVKVFCQTLISNNKKKTIILDDIDNINEQSQQVFRNYLDKYSKNVNFIASCTNIQKVIGSFQSRILIVKLNNFTNNNLLEIMNNICIKENIIINNESKEYIIKLTNNSVRTLICYIEKIKILNKKIDLNTIYNLSTNINFTSLINYTNLCKKNKLVEAINLFIQIYDLGYSVMDIFDSYFSFLKIYNDIDINKKYSILKLLCKYISNFYIVHEDEIELVFFTNKLITILHTNN
jgi:DNA polymerase III delta prime subunit